MHNSPKVILERLLVRTNLFIPSRFWTLYKVWQLLSVSVTSCGNFLYRCTSTFSALNYCNYWNFLQLSAIYTKWCAQTFPPIFGFFAIFDRNFAKLVAPSSNENENYGVHLKQQSIRNKALKTASKSTHKPPHNTCLNYVPHAQADQTWHTKQEAQLMLTTGSTRLAVSRGQQTWYHSTCYI